MGGWTLYCQPTESRICCYHVILEMPQSAFPEAITRKQEIAYPDSQDVLTLIPANTRA